ncbi:MAG: asparaginase [bacterium]|nr:asparaginase [bacterium]
MKITFIQTGGTIDKDYPKTIQGYAFEISEPAVTRILEKLNPAFETEIITALRKDSMDITSEDRLNLKEICGNISNDKIIITHGTDTMIETADVLADIKEKTIVITGAMRPERFGNSDAPINVGIAIGAVTTLPHGVYIAMHGNVHKWDQITRDPQSNQFIAAPTGNK